MKKEIERKINSNYSIKPSFEPKRSNRWVIYIPELKIESYLFQSISLPTVGKEKMGWKGYKTPTIEPIEITLIETIDSNHYGVFIEHLKDNTNLTIWVKYLNVQGNELGKILLEKCKIIKVSQSPLSYEKDDLIKTFVIVKPLSVKFSK